MNQAEQHDYVGHRVLVHGSPNWLQKFREEHFHEDNTSDLSFDFETFIRQPKDLDRTDTSDETNELYQNLLAVINGDEKAFIFLRGKKLANPFALEPAWERLRFLVETGYDSWETWRLKHWGTKWPAFDTRIDNETLSGPLDFVFTTTNYTPLPILNRMASVWLCVQFEVHALHLGNNYCYTGWFNAPNRKPLYRYSDDAKTISKVRRIIYPNY